MKTEKESEGKRDEGTDELGRNKERKLEKGGQRE